MNTVLVTAPGSTRNAFGRSSDRPIVRTGKLLRPLAAWSSPSGDCFGRRPSVPGRECGAASAARAAVRPIRSGRERFAPGLDVVKAHRQQERQGPTPMRSTMRCLRFSATEMCATSATSAPRLMYPGATRGLPESSAVKRGCRPSRADPVRRAPTFRSTDAGEARWITGRRPHRGSGIPDHIAVVDRLPQGPPASKPPKVRC
jgi:hypothetical protein